MNPIRRTALILCLTPWVWGCTAQNDTNEPNDQPDALPRAESRVVDLTHPFDSETIYWPTGATFERVQDSQGYTAGGFYYESGHFSSPEHGGTHLDAPIHFFEGRDSVEAIPLDRLIGPGVLIDATAACAADRDHRIGLAELKAWESAHGPFPDGAIVLLHTGFGRFWPDRTAYMGTDLRGEEGVAALHFPGLDPQAVGWLVERGIAAIGLDTPSIDHGPSTGFESHVALFEQNIPAFENVAHLDLLPPVGFTVIALPMKIRGGSGAPLRIVARLDR